MMASLDVIIEYEDLSNDRGIAEACDKLNSLNVCAIEI